MSVHFPTKGWRVEKIDISDEPRGGWQLKIKTSRRSQGDAPPSFILVIGLGMTGNEFELAHCRN